MLDHSPPRSLHHPARPAAACSAPFARALACAGMWLAASMLAAVAHASGPIIWDDNGDGIDDRIGSVHALGYQFSFENSDTLGRQRFEVTRVGADLLYGIYVRYDHAPTLADFTALGALGVTVRHRLVSLPAVRVRANYTQVSAIRSLPGVVRIEVVPYLYASTRDACAAIGVRDVTGAIAPTVAGTNPSADGHGVVVAILDTGVNDAATGSYPGHEALLGRCLGGADFTTGDSLVDTPLTGSINPVDPAVGPLAGHGTHVASIVLGSGGPTGLCRGVAPAAMFVDVRVLGPLGAGDGLPEALDWCIVNRARHWGAADTTYRGIDVINLSLSGTDQSDGQDLLCAMANAAASAGIVVVASTGNDGISGQVPPPAAADQVIAVGAFDDQRTGPPADDLDYASNNVGPRASDGDLDLLDELRPTLLAPGVSVLAANGDLTTDGTRYVRHTGTSMAAAFVTGAVAALRSLDPTLDPATVQSTLVATARRNGPGVPAGTPQVDPRWAPSRGFGLLDLYAAVLERTQTTHTQFRRFMLTRTDTTIGAEAWTMRERGAAFIVFQRAPDVGGVPGTYTSLDSLPAVGDPNLDDGQDTRVYTRSWSVPPAEYGTRWWYRVVANEGASRWLGPENAITAPTGPAVATVYATIVHDAYDTDVSGTLSAGGGAYTQPLPGSSSAIVTDYVDGASAIGTIARTFQFEIPSGAASAWLPPSHASIWAMRLTEGGFLNRSGRLTDFRLVWHSPSGDLTYVWGPGVLPTIEGSTVEADLPNPSVGVPDGAGPVVAVRPNPAVAGGLVSFARPAGAHGTFEVFDLAGRRVGQVADSGSPGTPLAWRAVDSGGRPLAAGVYLARWAGRPATRFVLISR